MFLADEFFEMPAQFLPEVACEIAAFGGIIIVYGFAIAQPGFLLSIFDVAIAAGGFLD